MAKLMRVPESPQMELIRESSFKWGEVGRVAMSRVRLKARGREASCRTVADEEDGYQSEVDLRKTG